MGETASAAFEHEIVSGPHVACLLHKRHDRSQRSVLSKADRRRRGPGPVTVSHTSRHAAVTRRNGRRSAASCDLSLFEFKSRTPVDAVAVTGRYGDGYGGRCGSICDVKGHVSVCRCACPPRSPGSPLCSRASVDIRPRDALGGRRRGRPRGVGRARARVVVDDPLPRSAHPLSGGSMRV